jgi:FkbM family methyltransferase
MLRQIAGRIKLFESWRRSAGWQPASAFAGHRIKGVLGLPQSATLTIKPRRAMYPVSARLGGSSDMEVFSQIFVDDEYSCVSDIGSPGLIFDLGANVGYSSAYFLTNFPMANVVAVEPDPANFEVCLRNLTPYGDRVKTVCGAVWSSRSKLALSRGTFGDGREWASQVRKIEGKDVVEEVEGWDIPSLLNLAGKEQIDLLKVDIEGSEIDVFGPQSSAWLPKVRNICIELHGPRCEEVFFHAVREFDYQLVRFGELTVCKNLYPKLPAVDH